MAELIETEAHSADAFGFAFMYHQARRYPLAVEWCKENHVRIIHLIRRNALKVVVSRAVANKRRQANKARKVYMSSVPLEPTSVSLNIPRLRLELDRLASSTDEFRTLFSGFDYIEVEYESLVGGQEVESTRILKFLGADVLPLSTTLVKTSPDALADIIENFREVCQELEGSQYEKYLS